MAEKLMTSNKDGLQFITNGKIIVVELRYIIDYFQTITYIMLKALFLNFLY